MSPSQVRDAEPAEIIAFFDAGRDIDMTHHRRAIANAQQRILELMNRVESLEARIHELEMR
jgi:hydroxymethylpyrimidine pyrophosphatase-like HAD family hydrolase